MLYKKNIAVVGGDMRQAYLANKLIEQNNEYRVCGMFLDKDVKLSPLIHKSNDVKLMLPGCGIVIFPLILMGPDGMLNTPSSEQRVTVEECLEYISTDAVVLAGMVPDEVHELAKTRGIEIIDYFKREEFAVLNAVPTALYKIPDIFRNENDGYLEWVCGNISLEGRTLTWMR